MGDLYTIKPFPDNWVKRTDGYYLDTPLGPFIMDFTKRKGNWAFRLEIHGRWVWKSNARTDRDAYDQCKNRYYQIIKKCLEVHEEYL